MSRVPAALSVICIFAVCLRTAPAAAQWVDDGIPVIASGNPQSHCVVPDGAGGSIVVWWDVYRILAQRIGAGGYLKWDALGDTLSTNDHEAGIPVAVPDGAGGAMVAWHATWYDEINGKIYYEVFAQRIDSTGSRLWGDEGVLVRIDTTDASNPDIAIDTAGRCVVTWNDFRTEADYDVYAQQIGGAGAKNWAENGVAVCVATGDQLYPRIVSDEAGGTIVVWQDSRSGDSDIYAQRLDQSGAQLWAGGAAVCVYADENQISPMLVVDGAGGAIILWEDSRHFFDYGYCQRIDSLGAPLWTAGGIAVPSVLIMFSVYEHQRIVPDGSGGAIISWEEARSSGNGTGIFAQRFDANGTRLWSGDITVCDEAGNQSEPEIASSPGGGAVIAWTDDRGPTQDVFAQIVDGDGDLLLAASGGLVCGAANGQLRPMPATDGPEGATIVWRDTRTTWSLYAQHVDPGEGWRSSDHAIISVDDVSPDQGGWVRIHLAASIYDTPGAAYEVTSYNVWRLIPGAVAMAEDAPGEPAALPAGEIPAGTRICAAQAILLGLPPGAWESLGMHPALQEDEYFFAAPTSDDSTSAGIPWETYVVSIHSTSPSFHIFCAPDSGYSVDDLAPGAPPALTGEQSFDPAGLQLTWDPVAAGDLWHYAVHRGTSGGFLPDGGNRIGATVDTEWFDTGWSWDGGYWYKVAAVDRHGNESIHAVLGPDMITGEEPAPTPHATFLAQNWPNPFNPSTSITFGLKERGHVSLRIYDAAGRLVTDLIEEGRPAGRYAVEWDGRSDDGTPAASGVYFYRLRAGSFERTRKMILLR